MIQLDNISKHILPHQRNVPGAQKRLLTGIIREDRFGSLPVLTGKLNSDLETTLHTSTVRRYLQQDGAHAIHLRITLGGCQLIVFEL